MGTLQPDDDLPVHPADTGHPRWTERWYFNVQDASGALVAIFGGGFYPYTGVLETYACLLVDGRQTNIRSRTIAADRHALHTGSGATFTIAERMQRWQFGVEEGAALATLDFQATGVPFLFAPFSSPAVGSDAPDDFDEVQHFVQPGMVTGVLSLDGHTIDLAGARSFRDRTWGIRSRRPRLHSWFVAHLDGGGYVAAIRQERADGTVMTSELAWIDAAGATRYAEIDEHELSFDPRTRLLLHGTIRAHTDDGAPVTLEVDNIGEGIRLSGAGYVAGQGTGEQRAVAGETWDLADPEVVAAIGPGTIDSPVAARFVVDGHEQQGTGVSEFAVARNHHRYGGLLG